MDRAASQVETKADDRFPVRRSGKYLRPDNSACCCACFFRATTDAAARSSSESEMSPVEVEDGLQNVVRRLSHKHARIETVFSYRYHQLAHLLPAAAFAAAGTADRRLLHERIQPAVGGAVQSIDRPAPVAGGCS